MRAFSQPPVVSQARLRRSCDRVALPREGCRGSAEASQRLPPRGRMPLPTASRSYGSGRVSGRRRQQKASAAAAIFAAEFSHGC